MYHWPLLTMHCSLQPLWMCFMQSPLNNSSFDCILFYQGGSNGGGSRYCDHHALLLPGRRMSESSDSGVHWKLIKIQWTPRLRHQAWWMCQDSRTSMAPWAHRRRQVGLWSTLLLWLFAPSSSSSSSAWALMAILWCSCPFLTRCFASFAPTLTSWSSTCPSATCSSAVWPLPCLHWCSSWMQAEEMECRRASALPFTWPALASSSCLWRQWLSLLCTDCAWFWGNSPTELPPSPVRWPSLPCCGHPASPWLPFSPCERTHVEMDPACPTLAWEADRLELCCTSTWQTLPFVLLWCLYPI